MAEAPTVSAALERKIDELTVQVAFLAEEAAQARVRRLQWQELATDLAPVADQAMEMASRELDGLSHQTSLEDLAALFRRFLSTATTIERSLAQLQSLAELGEELTPISGEVIEVLTRQLAQLDERGYFNFVRSGIDVADRVVTGFSAEDIEQLGNNVVLILETVKEMTQPEVMGMLQGTAFAIQETQHDIESGTESTPSLWALGRQMRDPDVRRGMGRALEILSALSHANPEPNHSPSNQSQER